MSNKEFFNIRAYLLKRKQAKIEQLQLLNILRPVTSTRNSFRLKFQIYSEYLCSTDWKQLRDIFYLTVRKICISCGSYDDLQVHHSTYLHLGTKDEIDDLKIVCDSCHVMIHKLKKENDLKLNVATSLIIGVLNNNLA